MSYTQLLSDRNWIVTAPSAVAPAAHQHSRQQSSSAIHFFICFSSFCCAARMHGRFMMRAALLYLLLPLIFKGRTLFLRLKRHFQSPISC